MTGSDNSETVEEWLNKPLEDVTVDSVNTDKTQGYVPIAELEQLAERWVQERDKALEDDLRGYAAGNSDCIMELRSLIADYRGETDG